MRLQELYESEILLEITADEIPELKDKLSAIMKPLGMGVSFRRHFSGDRAVKREESVDADDIIASFKRMKTKFSPQLKKAAQIAQQKGARHYRATLKDWDNAVNYVFGVDPDPRGKGTLLDVMTVKFRTPQNFKSFDVSDTFEVGDKASFSKRWDSLRRKREEKKGDISRGYKRGQQNPKNVEADEKAAREERQRKTREQMAADKRGGEPKKNLGGRSTLSRKKDN